MQEESDEGAGRTLDSEGESAGISFGIASLSALGLGTLAATTSFGGAVHSLDVIPAGAGLPAGLLSSPANVVGSTSAAVLVAFVVVMLLGLKIGR
jgi:hypothetical protein